MEMNFETLYPHHDMLIELGLIAMTMDGSDERSHQSRQPDLEARMSSLLTASDYVAL